MNYETPVGPATRLAVGMLAIITIIFWLLAMGVDLSYFYAASGFSILTLSLLPVLAMKTYDWFCPWSSVLLAEVYGCTLPSLCMTFGWPNDDIIESHILLGQDVGYFVLPSLIVILSIAFIAVGYFCFPTREDPRTVYRVVDPSRLMMVCLVCFVVSTLALAAYYVVNGGISDGISSKRGTIKTLDVGGDEGFSQYGYLRQAAKLATIAMLLLVAYWTKFKQPNGKFGQIRALIIFALFLVSIAFPFYSSSRAGIVWVIASLAGALYYFRQRLFTWHTGAMVGVVVSLVLVTTFLRNETTNESAGVEERLGRLMLNRHGPDIATSSHVINAIPEKLSYQYGKTIAVWAIAPVPREIFPSKPLVHSGPIIGQAVYGMNVSGVPPGMPAELFWNFHVFGVIVGSFFVGLILKIIYNFFRNIDVDPVLLVPCYIYAVFPIGFKALTHSIGLAFVMSMVELIMIGVIAIFVSRQMSPLQIHQMKAQPLPPTTAEPLSPIQEAAARLS